MTHTNPGQIITYSIGRYLIDLPAEAHYRGGRFSYAYTDIEIEARTQEAFLEEIRSEEKKMKGLTHGGDSPLLVNVLRLGDDSSVLAYWKHDTSREAIVDGYRWLNGKRYLFRRIVSGPKIDEGTAWMKNFISLVRPLNGEISVSRGFCILDAIILDDGRTYPESADLHFEFQHKKDITLDISTSVNEGNPPESLLSRKPSVMGALGTLGATLAGVRTIKEGDRKIGDTAGQQWLITAPNDVGHKAHLFTWEAPGATRDKMHPQIRVDLESAKYGQGVEPGPASLTDQEMLKLWEKILNSLRLRPTDDGKSSTADDKKSPPGISGDVLPLGELARTGMACPQTGYWNCPENDLNGSTRLFKQGDVMPTANVKRELSFIERVKGTSDHYNTNTVWRLVRYAEADEKTHPVSPSDAVTDQPASDTQT
ncbi:hypothetical protein RugamoR57_33400 [Duganella caerulea]